VVTRTPDGPAFLSDSFVCLPIKAKVIKFFLISSTGETPDVPVGRIQGGGAIAVQEMAGAGRSLAMDSLGQQTSWRVL